MRARVTDRVKPEEALRQSEAKYREVLEMVPDLLFRVDRNGTFLEYVHSGDVPLYSDPEEFIGQTIGEVLPPPLAKQAEDALAAVFRTMEHQEIEYTLIVDGSPREFEARFLRSGDVEALVIIRDISRRKETEEKMIRIERLGAVGEMGNGVAHNFNNLLVGVLGYA